MGKLIVLEGLDGSGKSTQFALLSRRLQEEGIPVKGISFPDYKEDSSALVKMYLAGEFGKNPGDVNAYAASAFYAVDRYASYRKYWKNPYESGTLILAARYTTSNAVHQMGKLPEKEWTNYLHWLEDFEYNKLGLPRPDQVIFLDMPAEVSQKLIMNRYNGDASRKDIHEDLPYLSECRPAAMFAGSYWNWEKISCAGNGIPLPALEISNSIYDKIKIHF